MSQLLVLFEHASGYSLFRVAEFEEISMFLPQVTQSVSSLAKFRSIVQLVAFQPFKTGKDALENINHSSEGLVHNHLQLFLESNVPRPKKKKQPVVLGVSDPKLAVAINEMLGFTVESVGVVPEIERGIRQHFPNLVSGLQEENAAKAQLGLSHNYCRAKVKFNVNRVDNMIIQSIALLDQLDKDINTFAMRVREWYSYHFPELFKLVPDNVLYAKAVAIVKDRTNMDEDVAEKLEEVLMDSTKVQNVLEVASTSMGMEISPMDLLNIETFTGRIVHLAEYRSQLSDYLKSRMHDIAPNLAALIGETVGARLISHAGSLTNLAKYPASTVQILGAEKALFRALKTRGNTPKYGLLFHSTFIGKAAKENKGRISRFLANKCSMASRIDCFAEIPTEIFGQTLKQQVEDRLKFLTTGEKPEKNIDVMSVATDQAKVIQDGIMKEQKKKEKKERKRKRALENSTMESEDATLLENEAALPETEEILNGMPPKKKKKKAAIVEEAAEAQIEENAVPEEPMHAKKKKKKKQKQSLQNSIIESQEASMFEDDVIAPQENEELLNSSMSSKKKKGKNKKAVSLEESAGNHIENEVGEQETPSKKKKKKMKSV